MAFMILYVCPECDQILQHGLPLFLVEVDFLVAYLKMSSVWDCVPQASPLPQLEKAKPRDPSSYATVCVVPEMEHTGCSFEQSSHVINSFPSFLHKKCCVVCSGPSLLSTGALFCICLELVLHLKTLTVFVKKDASWKLLSGVGI